MGGETGASMGESEDVGEREDALDGKECSGGRRTAGRMMPVSGVDGPEVRLQVVVSGGVDFARLVFEGEPSADPACRVSRERPSGISSRNSCLGDSSWSTGCDKGRDEGGWV